MLVKVKRVYRDTPEGPVLVREVGVCMEAPPGDPGVA